MQVFTSFQENYIIICLLFIKTCVKSQHKFSPRKSHFPCENLIFHAKKQGKNKEFQNSGCRRIKDFWPNIYRRLGKGASRQNGDGTTNYPKLCVANFLPRHEKVRKRATLIEN